MATYIQLLTLTQEGREKALKDPESVLHAQDNISVPGVQVLGLYGVLGQYDFVNMVEAVDNEAVARFSLNLGVQAGAHITTLPAIPIGRMDTASHEKSSEAETVASSPTPDDMWEQR